MLVKARREQQTPESWSYSRVGLIPVFCYSNTLNGQIFFQTLNWLVKSILKTSILEKRKQGREEGNTDSIFPFPFHPSSSLKYLTILSWFPFKSTAPSQSSILQSFFSSQGILLYQGPTGSHSTAPELCVPKYHTFT